MQKPFKGVISNWSLVDNRVHGICVLHTTYDNGIQRGESITTSQVESITHPNGVLVLQTRNSLYVLV